MNCHDRWCLKSLIYGWVVNMIVSVYKVQKIPISYAKE